MIPPHSPVKILIVDDREENLTALQAALSSWGYEVVAVLSGAEAIVRASETDFVAILLDVQMPGMDGFEAAQRIRQIPRARATPLIFVTAIHREEEYEHAGYIAGAVDYLFKPLNVDILKAKLEVFSDLYRKNEENLRQAELLKAAALREQENKLLREAILARDEFLAMASHELKTPLTPLILQMQAFIQMYKDGTIDRVPRDRLLRLLETSQSQVGRISRLVNDLVDVSRIKSGRIRLEKQKLDLGKLTEGIVSVFSEQAEEAFCRLTFEAERLVVGHWDRLRIEQVIFNLLVNALKYGTGRPVEVAVRSREGNGVLIVRDHGIGIDPADHERIFERFERAVSARHYGGLGLGLFIAKQIVKLHGGRISVDSALGQGAKFVVELPLTSGD